MRQALAAVPATRLDREGSGGYFSGMASPNPVRQESRRISICRPSPLWIAYVVVVVVAVAAGLRIGIPIYRQKAALHQIERLGGSVLETQRGGPKWLRDHVGDDPMMLFDEVINVNLGGTQANDATMNWVSCLTKLRHCSLVETQVTDAGLVHLRGMTDLQSLYLANTRITDKGLEYLTGLTELKWLWLDNTNVTDAGLVHLTGLAGLQELWLHGTQVTDAGVADLERVLPRLTIMR
jgi:hypothetical protein